MHLFLSGCFTLVALFYDVASDRSGEDTLDTQTVAVTKAGSMASIKEHSSSTPTGNLGAHAAGGAIPVPDEMTKAFAGVDKATTEQILKYFGGDDKGVPQSERDGMQKTLKYFDGGQDDDVLSQVQAQAMDDVVGAFAAGGTIDDTKMKDMMYVIQEYEHGWPDKSKGGWLDTDRKLLTAFVKAFAGEDKKLSTAEIADAKTTISYFDGGGETDMLTEKEARAMDAVVAYFAGKDSMLDDAETKSMLEIIVKFDIADTSKGGWLDKERAMLVKFTKSFAGTDEALDNDEIESMKAMMKYFVGTGVRKDMLSEAEAKDMDQVVGYFDGADNMLDKAETEQMMDVIKLFDCNNSGKLSTTRRQALVDACNTADNGDGKSSANGNGELSATEIEEVKKNTSCLEAEKSKACGYMIALLPLIVAALFI